MPPGPRLALTFGEHGGDDESEAETDPEADEERRRRVTGDHPLGTPVAPAQLVSRRFVTLAEGVPQLFGSLLDALSDIFGRVTLAFGRTPVLPALVARSPLVS